MHIVKSTKEDIFGFSKISKKYAIADIKPYIGEFIYFSASNSSHGPRIKFYGGSSETTRTEDCPALAFDNQGNCTIELADWMNRKNCPNAYDHAYMQRLEQFVQMNLPILLLVWYRHVDEGTAIAYYYGTCSLAELISDIDYAIPNAIITREQLHQYCQEHQLYRF